MPTPGIVLDINGLLSCVVGLLVEGRKFYDRTSCSLPCPRLAASHCIVQKVYCLYFYLGLRSSLAY